MQARRARNAVRLQRALADAGVASRRDCEAYIEQGLVEVNGQVVKELPVFIDPGSDRVRVRGRPVELRSRRSRAAEGGLVYIAVNKPDRTLATTRDEAPGVEAETGRGARRTVLDLVKSKNLPRLYPVGRLGFHDTGLVLLTNDGEIANRLTHARYGVPRTYVVFVRGRVPAPALEKIRRRVTVSLGPGAPPADPLRVRALEDGDTELSVTLRESPKLRIDALIFESGLKVKRLVRTAIGPVSIRGIVSGSWRFLTRFEVKDLLAAAGLDAPVEAPPRAADRARQAAPARAGDRPRKPAPARRPRRNPPAVKADQGGKGRPRRA